MEKFRYTRLNKIYPSKDDALTKLSSISRYYGETVAARYKEGKSIYTLLCLYRSEDVGDYDIQFDSKIGISKDTRAFKTTKLDNETDKEAIARIYFDKGTPMQGDYIFLKNQGGEESIYIYISGEWLSLNKVFIVIGETTDSLDINVFDNSEGTFKVSGRVKRIDGGNLKDIL